MNLFTWRFAIFFDSESIFIKEIPVSHSKIVELRQNKKQMRFSCPLNEVYVICCKNHYRKSDAKILIITAL